MGGVRRGGKRASKMTGTGSKGKRSFAKYKKLLPFSVQKAFKGEKNLPFRKRKNKIDIKETGLK